MTRPIVDPVAQIQIGRIRMHPRNVRTALTGLETLAASIRQVGVLQPLVVHRKYRPGAGVQDLELLMGHRRLAAAEIAGRTRVPCIIRPYHTDDQAIIAMLGENTQREPADSKGLQKAVQALRDEFDYEIETIAEKTGVPVEQVQAWLAGTTTIGFDTPTGTPRRRPAAGAPVRRRHRAVSITPRVTARKVHELLTEHDTGRLDAGEVVARFRGLLGGWQPASRPTTPVPAAADPVDLQEPAGPPASGVALGERELQVLRGMAAGMSNAEIGRKLFLSEDTVKTHARRLFSNLGVRDRAHAVARGYQRGILAGGSS